VIFTRSDAAADILCELADVPVAWRPDAEGMSIQKVFVGFVPWIVFSLVATRVGPGAVGAGCLLALIVAVGLVVRSVFRGESPKLLEVTGAVVFLGLGVLSLADAGADTLLATYGRAIAAAILAAVIFLLLPAMPFTEQYARESVSRQYWHTREFRSINRRISAAWGGVIAAMAVSHLVGGLFELPDPGVGLLHRPVDLLFNWIVPGLLVWAAFRYTQRASGDQPPAQHATALAPRGGNTGRR
jgi:hypothetical protein